MKLYKEYLLKSESFTESAKLKKIEELKNKDLQIAEEVEILRRMLEA